MKCSLGISNFLFFFFIFLLFYLFFFTLQYCIGFAIHQLIFLKRCLVFPILLFSFISLHWLLREAFLSLLAILWNSAFRCLYLFFLLCFLLPFFSQLFVRPPQTAILLFLQMVLIPVSCTMSQTSLIFLFFFKHGTLLDIVLDPEKDKKNYTDFLSCIWFLFFLRI